MGLVSDQIDVILTGYFYQLLQTISLFLDLFSCEIFFFSPKHIFLRNYRDLIICLLLKQMVQNLGTFFKMVPKRSGIIMHLQNNFCFTFLLPAPTAILSLIVKHFFRCLSVCSLSEIVIDLQWLNNIQIRSWQINKAAMLITVLVVYSFFNGSSPRTCKTLHTMPQNYCSDWILFSLCFSV